MTHLKMNHWDRLKRMKRLSHTTSLLVLATTSSVAAQTPNDPGEIQQQSSSNFQFDVFMPENSRYPQLVGLSGDGSTLLMNFADESNLLIEAPYTWRDGQGSTQETSVNIRASAINMDGSVYVGMSSQGGQSQAIRVTSSGIDYLGTLGGVSSTAVGVSDDGNAVTGDSTLSDYRSHAFYWSTSTNSLFDLGTLGGINSYAAAISGDGTTVVGISERNDGDNHAFRWKVGGAITDLGTLDGDTNSNALAVSTDGSVIAGSSGFAKLFRWTETSNQMVDLGTLDIDHSNDSEWGTGLSAMSRDGSTIVGYVSGAPRNAPSYRRAFRWNVSGDGVTGTMLELSSLGGTTTIPSALSADGSVIVGSGTDSAGTSHGFRWTEATDTLTVDEWLRRNGVALTSDITQTAGFISADGKVVAGTTYDGNFYYARVNRDYAGIITANEFLSTAQSAAVTPSNAQLSYANTAMFGAEGSPMRNLLNAGQRSAWGTVDSGYDKSDAADGGFALGEFGLGYGLAEGVTGRIALGGTYTNQDLEGGGDFNYKGFYVAPEVTANIASNLYITLGGYYANGKIDIHRGYLNGLSLDFSNGNTDARTFGGKLRFDWLDAVTIADTAITPYIGLSRANSKVDAYAENGGGFPVAYDEMNDHATIARLGADYVHPLTENVNLLARTEVAHRFEDQSSVASAEIIGLSSVDLPGQDLKQWWVRGGLGAEFAVGGGTASLMVNASTEGGDPRVWLRSGWKVNF